MDTNQTNIEQADEIAGYLTNVGILTGKTTTLYINFLAANPAALSILGFVLLIINLK